MKPFITLTFLFNDKPLRLNPLSIESIYKTERSKGTFVHCSKEIYNVKETPDEIETLIEEWMKHQVGTIQ